MNKRRTSETGNQGQGHTTRSGLGTYGRTPRDLLRDPTISVCAKAVFGLLEDYSSPDRPRPFPSAGTLGEYLGCSTSTVRRALRELRDAGWVRVWGRTDGSGAQTSNEYELCPVSVVTSDRGGQEWIGGVVMGDQGGCAPVTNEEEPDEEEPLKKCPSNVSVSPPPLHGVDGNGWESDETVRQVVASICRASGLHQHRDAFAKIVAHHLARSLTPQQIYDQCTGIDWNKVTSPVGVLTHRLDKIEPRTRTVTTPAIPDPTPAPRDWTGVADSDPAPWDVESARVGVRVARECLAVWGNDAAMEEV